MYIFLLDRKSLLKDTIFDEKIHIPIVLLQLYFNESEKQLYFNNV